MPGGRRLFRPWALGVGFVVVAVLATPGSAAETCADLAFDHRVCAGDGAEGDGDCTGGHYAWTGVRATGPGVSAFAGGRSDCHSYGGAMQEGEFLGVYLQASGLADASMGYYRETRADGTQRCTWYVYEGATGGAYADVDCPFTLPTLPWGELGP